MVSLVGLLVVASLLPTVGASPTLPSVPTLWAFSGSQNVSGAGNVSTPDGNYGYAYHGVFTDVAVFNQTNTSASTFEVQGEQAIQVVYYLTICQPSCTQPVAQTNLSLTSWQGISAWANLTRLGSVDENGTPVTAVGLINDTSTASANVTGLVQWTAPGSSGWWGGSPPTQGYQYASVASTATESIAFTPALGLVPVNHVPGASWESNASYNGSESASVAYHLDSSQGGNVSGNPQGSQNISGQIYLFGGDQSFFTLRNGWLTNAIAFEFSRGLRFWDGIFLVPATGDLFLGNDQPWQTPGGPFITAGTTALDFDPAFGHFGVVASSVDFDPIQLGESAGLPPSEGWSAPGGFSPHSAQPRADPPQTVTVQTEPVAAPTAESTVGGVTHVPLGFSSIRPAPSGQAILAPWVVIAVAGVIGLLGAAALQGQRRADSRGPRGNEAYDTYRAGLGPEPSTAIAESSTAPAVEDPFRDLV